MREKPPLDDSPVLAVLDLYFNRPGSRLEFLPLGNESGVSVYRARHPQGDLFVKLRATPFNPAALQVAHFLHVNYLPEVVAPLAGRDGSLFYALDGGNTMIVYPYIEGPNGMDVGLSAAQWSEFGRILGRLHAVQLPRHLADLLPVESFTPPPLWLDILEDIEARVQTGNYRDALEQTAGRLWKTQAERIANLRERTVELGQFLRQRSLPPVLCHSDIHTANLLLTYDGRMNVVDWDEPRLAPKEQDLMFICAPKPKQIDLEEAQFFTGYGAARLDWEALAYYHGVWALQELADEARRLFCLVACGEDTRRQSAKELKRLFLAGQEVAVAEDAAANVHA